MEDPISHNQYGQYPPSSSSSSPTEVGSPTSFHKSLPTPPTLDSNDSSKVLLFTMFQLLQRIEAQIEGQETRLKSIESSMSLRTQFHESQSQSQKDLWGNVVKEYERSILNLRRSIVEGDGEHESQENTKPHGRTNSDHLGVADQDDEDTYSVSVYSGNILDRALEQGNEDSPREDFQSIRYETDTMSNTGDLASNPARMPWEQPARSPSQMLSRRSHQFVEVASANLGAWKVAVISKYKLMKQDIRQSSTTQGPEAFDAEEGRTTNQRLPRPLYKLVGRTYFILDSGSTKLALKVKRKWNFQKGIAVLSAKRVGQFSKANLKHVKKTLGTFKEGFVAY